MVYLVCYTIIVYIYHTRHSMRNITLSADEDLIERAREKARQERKSLNALFRSWLRELTGEGLGSLSYKELMERIGDSVKAGSGYSRDEMNER